MTPTLGDALAAYLGLGACNLPWPGTDYDRLVDLVGDNAGALQKRLEAVLSSIDDTDAFIAAKSLSDIATLAAARAKHLHPEFNDVLCAEIGRYFSYSWK